MSVTGRFLIRGTAEHAVGVPENRTGTVSDYISANYDFTNGVGSGQCDLAWSDRRQLAAGATDTILLSGGGLTDPYGGAVNFVEVCGIIIRNRENVAGTRTLQFGPSGVQPFVWLFAAFTHRIVIVPASSYCAWSNEAQTVAPGNDQIDIINTDGANTVDYDIFIIGRSA